MVAALKTEPRLQKKNQSTSIGYFTKFVLGESLSIFQNFAIMTNRNVQFISPITSTSVGFVVSQESGSSNLKTSATILGTTNL